MTIRRTLRVVAAVAVLVHGAGCAARRDAWISTDPAHPRITDDQRNQAMLSIHAHANRPGKDFDGLEFMDFDDAVDVLVADTGRRADSRARRAIAELVAHTYPRQDYRTDAVKRLLLRPVKGEPLALDYHTLIAQMEAAAALEIPTLDLSPPLDAPALYLVLINLLTTMTPECPYVAWKTKSIGQAPPIMWTFELYVPRSMNDVARSLDPQHWNEASTLFHATYLVDTPSCCPKTSASNCAYTSTTAPDPATGAAAGDPVGGARRPAGAPYASTALFENFCVGSHCPDCKDANSQRPCAVAFKNLLCAWTEYDRWVPFQCLSGLADRYDVHYDHAAFLFGELGGSELGKEIRGDQGQLYVRRLQDDDPPLDPRAEWSFVHVQKTLNFVDWGNTIGAGDILRQTYARELQQQIAEQVCYEVPVEGWLVP